MKKLTSIGFFGLSNLSRLGTFPALVDLVDLFVRESRGHTTCRAWTLCAVEHESYGRFLGYLDRPLENICPESKRLIDASASSVSSIRILSKRSNSANWLERSYLPQQ